MTIDDMSTAAAAVDAAKKAAKDARRAMSMTLFAVAVAILVLAIDHTIKRAIISEAGQVREIFAQFQEATSAIRAAAEQDGTGASPVDGPADPGSGGVADDTGARTAPNGDAPARKPAASRSKSSTRPRP
jgi:hypothetical protein